VTCLLDTCTLIWLCSEPARLSAAARRAIDAADAELAFADASALEIALKWQSGKISLPEPPRIWIARQCAQWSVRPVPITREHIFRLTELPDHHRDPFDRLLVAAALAESATILTPDLLIRRYPVAWCW
jgi:PIN domain nuclease of toxin-antitoxin system